MQDVPRLDFDVSWAAVTDRGVRPAVDGWIRLARPGETHTGFRHLSVHVGCDIFLRHPHADVFERFAIDLVRDRDCFADALHFGWRFASTQGVDHRLGADQSVRVGGIAQVIEQHLVHGVSQSVSLNVVL